MKKLSKNALEMLEYNGYSFRNKDNQLVFKHSAIDSIGLTVILFITVLLVIVLMIFNILYGLGAFLLSLFVFVPLVKRSKGKSRLVIDPKQKVLRILENNRSVSKGFSEILGVYTHSKLVDEYSSAFKSTNKEYRVTIGLEVDHMHIPLFKLIADHANPSKEANAVHDFLESVLRPQKNTQQSVAS